MLGLEPAVLVVAAFPDRERGGIGRDRLLEQVVVLLRNAEVHRELAEAQLQRTPERRRLVMAQILEPGPAVLEGFLEQSGVASESGELVERGGERLLSLGKGDGIGQAIQTFQQSPQRGMAAS